MKILKFIPYKVNEKIVLWFTSIALIILMIFVSVLPGYFMWPLTPIKWAVAISLGLLIFMFITLIIAGLLVRPMIKDIEKEEASRT